MGFWVGGIVLCRSPVGGLTASVSEGESGEEVSPGSGNKRTLMVVDAELLGMGVTTFYSGNQAAKFARICGFK